jgi:division protein 1
MNSFGGMMQGLLGNIAANRPGAPPASPPPLRPRDANGPQQPQQVVDPLPGIMSQFFPLQAGSRSPGPPGMRDDDIPPNPLMGMMRMILSGYPLMNVAGHGDAAYSQEEFDRIMSQLLEQAQQGGGAPPASQQEIATIPKKTVTQEWLDTQDSKECTICMEEAQLGTEISELWCQHWFHQDCIKMWLDTHDQCPLCRKPLQQGREEAEAKQSKGSRRERRHSSRSYSHNNWRGSRDEGGSGGGGGGADASSGASIRDRLSSLFRGNSR